MSRHSAARNAELAARFRIGMLVSQKESIATELWRIADIEGRMARLAPISLGATELQAPLSDLRRYRIKATDQVFHDERLVKVRRLANPRADELMVYEVEGEDGEVESLREIDLTVHAGSKAPDPLEQLVGLDAAPADLALARVDLLHSFFAATACSLGILGYNGARMLPIPHQISAARHVLQFGRPRFILADEVGLGKTVEAGLIVSTLRKYFPDWRAAIFVPESLTVQWAFEMYGKFGKAIYRLEEDDPLDEDEDDPGVIQSHGKAAEWISARRGAPELLVIDEAHQVLRDPAAHAALLALSRKARAVLLLTATPTSDDGANLLKLLQLADPEAFAHLAGPGELGELMDKQDAVEELLRALRDPAAKPKDLRKLWEALDSDDEELTAAFLAIRVGGADMATRHRLAAVVTDKLLPGARILRYQRKFLAIHNQMAERVEEPIDFRPSKDEVEVRALLDEWLELLREAGLADDPEAQLVTRVLAQAVFSSPLAVGAWLSARRGEGERRHGATADPTQLHRERLSAMPAPRGEEAWAKRLEAANRKWTNASKSAEVKARELARLPRVEALLAQLKGLLADKDDPQRFIVFTSFEANVKPLWLLLNRGLGKDVEVFMISAEMPWREREKNAFAFQECRGPCVLVSDDLGGEGRNFQFANGLVHFDLPLAPWIVEQRIGRLDRVGRDPELDVDSQVLVAPGLLDESLYEFLREGVSVFNESIAPVEDLIEEEGRRFMTALIEGGGEQVRRLIERVAGDLEERREREIRALSARRDTGVEAVKALAPQLDDSRELGALAHATIRYTRLLGSMADHHDGRWTVTVGAHHPLHAMPGILPEMQGYFNRAEAVRHERLEFFSAGHPFVRTLARQALQECGDRVALVSRRGLERPLLVFSMRTHLPTYFLESVRTFPDDLQPAMLCSAGQHFSTTMEHVVVALDGTIIEPGTDEFALATAPHDRERDHSEHDGPGIFGLLPADWAEACHRAEAAARERAEASAAERLAARLPEFEAVVQEILARCHGLDFAVEAEVEALRFKLDPLTVELDAVVGLFPMA